MFSRDLLFNSKKQAVGYWLKYDFILSDDESDIDKFKEIVAIVKKIEEAKSNFFLVCDTVAFGVFYKYRKTLNLGKYAILIRSYDELVEYRLTNKYQADYKIIPLLKLRKYLTPREMENTPYYILYPSELEKYEKQGQIRKDILVIDINDSVDFVYAKALKASLYHGSYLTSAEKHTSKKLIEEQMSLIEFMYSVFRTDTNANDIKEKVEESTLFSQRLISIVNSGRFGITKEITDLQRAIVAIGFDKLKKFLIKWTLESINKRKDFELGRSILIYSRMYHILCEKFGLDGEFAFSIWLLRSVENIVDIRLEEILDQLTVEEETRDILLNRKGEYGLVLDMMESYINRDVTALKGLLSPYQLSIFDMTYEYFAAVIWYENYLGEKGRK